jgi:hypothetical protein
MRCLATTLPLFPFLLTQFMTFICSFTLETPKGGAAGAATEEAVIDEAFMACSTGAVNATGWLASRICQKAV